MGTEETTETSEDSGQKNFVTLGSLKNYATATASLTLVINIMLYVYSAVRNGKIMPVSLVIPLAILLSIAYIMSFFKRDKGLTTAQYIWITGLNGIMLFTSISGVNGMLDSARQVFSRNNQAAANDSLQTASVGGFFKHIFLPTHGWFNATEMNDLERTAIINSTISTIDTTNNVLNRLIQDRQTELTTIDTLHRQLDSVRNQYINTLDQFTQVENTVSTLRSFVIEHNLQGNIRTQLRDLQTTIDVKKTELRTQRGELQQHERDYQAEKQTNERQIILLRRQQTELADQKLILRKQQVRQPRPL